MFTNVTLPALDWFVFRLLLPPTHENTSPFILSGLLREEEEEDSPASTPKPEHTPGLQTALSRERIPVPKEMSAEHSRDVAGLLAAAAEPVRSEAFLPIILTVIFHHSGKISRPIPPHEGTRRFRTQPKIVRKICPAKGLIYFDIPSRLEFTSSVEL